MITKAAIEKVLPFLLKPIVRLCVRYGVKIHEVENATKELFVQEAKSYLQQSGEQESASKISVMTGLQRPIVRALAEKATSLPGESLLTKVIGAWSTKKKFLTSRGIPKTLSLEGKLSEFATLVSSVSQAVNPYTVLFELERAKLVKRTKTGLSLLSESFNSRYDVEKSLEYLAQDISDLASSIEKNINTPEGELFHHHLTTEYDNIPVDKAEKLQTLLLREGDKLHRRMRKMISRFDREDAPPSEPQNSVRVAFCSFSICEKKDLV